jgi:threonine dehydrogenase-like Zn-dependent dehydrogenase
LLKPSVRPVGHVRTSGALRPPAYPKGTFAETIGFYNGDWPRLIMQANYLESVTINPFEFVAGEGMIVLAPKDRGVEDRQKAIEAIRTGEISAADFISKPVPATDAPQAYKTLRDDKNNSFSLVFDWAK